MNLFTAYYENVISKVDWGQAVLIFVLGICTVFAVLAVLWAILACMKLVFANVSDKPVEEPANSNADAPVKSELRMSTPKCVATAAPQSGDELVAIFTAAVNAVDGSTNLRVKSYKKL